MLRFFSEDGTAPIVGWRKKPRVIRNRASAASCWALPSRLTFEDSNRKWARVERLQAKPRVPPEVQRLTARFAQIPEHSWDENTRAIESVHNCAPSLVVPNSTIENPIAYSVRSATIGSTVAARAAGIQDASSAAAQSKSVAMASMRGSHGETPKS